MQCAFPVLLPDRTAGVFRSGRYFKEVLIKSPRPFLRGVGKQIQYLVGGFVWHLFHRETKNQKPYKEGDNYE